MTHCNNLNICTTESDCLVRQTSSLTSDSGSAQVIQQKFGEYLNLPIASFSQNTTGLVFEEDKISAEPIPAMPTIVHLPQEHETTAATAFPQCTGIAKTFHKRTNQPPRTAQREYSLQSLSFFPVLFITPHFTSA